MNIPYIIKAVGYKRKWFKSPYGSHGRIGPLKLHLDQLEKTIILNVYSRSNIDINFKIFKDNLEISNLNILEIQCSDKSIKYTFKPNFLPDDTVNNILKVINTIENRAIKEYPNSNFLCEECGKNKITKPYSIQKSFFVFYCNECYEETNSQLKDVEQKYGNIKGNYTKATIGAILFSIPGIIIWLILQIYLGVISTLSPFLISILNIKGYEYCSGKIDGNTRYIFLFSNLVSLFIGASVVFIVSILQQGVELEAAISLIKDVKEYRVSFYEYILKSICLGLFISLIFFFAIKKPYFGIQPAKNYKWYHLWG